MLNSIKRLFQNISVFNTDASSMELPEASSDTIFTLLYNNQAVGELTFDGVNWKFSYTKMFQSQTEINPIPSFPSKDKKYESKNLWPFFQARIPSLKQPKVQAIIKRENIKENDIIGLLKLFGGRSINNPFVLQS